MAQDVANYLLHRRFDEQAEGTPDAVALVHGGGGAGAGGGGSITFAELQSRANALSASLSARGIRDGAMIGLYAERSIAYVVGVLAILKCNCAVVPLPPSYPEARIRDILSFASLDAVIDGNVHLDPTMHANIVHLSDAPRTGATTNEVVGGDASHTAFVLCSSGSTGKPKMIARSHRSFFHRLNWTWEHHAYMPGEVCCQKSHMTTTHAIYELFEPLLRGVPVHIISDEDTRNLERFWETIRLHHVSRLLIVPSVLQASLDMPGFVAPPINVLILMGEGVSTKLAGKAIDAFSRDTKIYSIYGSTEASSTLVCDIKESYRVGEELPLGKPISADVKALVLDGALAAVAPGASGLLHISGSALFTEYVGAPELTQASFVHAANSSDRLYNTQDEVRVLPNGSLQFVGRVDDTVKVRGFRVDLAEVERALLQHAQVSQATVLLSEVGVNSGAASLLAFYTPKLPDHVALYDVLRDRLPAYMIPSTLVGLDAFPLTPSGKVDRMKLREEHGRRRPIESAPNDSDASARSDTEQQVAVVWQRVLEHRDFDRDSSFFEVGGTSLIVFIAVHHLREKFSLDKKVLSAETMYQYPTVANLASYIDRVKQGSAAPAAEKSSALVVMKRGEDPKLAPFFVIASAGGTLGAYTELAKTLNTKRDIIGVRDPYNWGARDPLMGYQEWIGVYVNAMRERQPVGPYYVCAYSSGGSFGYEIAQQLRKAGQEVALLVLIDPLFIGAKAPGDFGNYTHDAVFGGAKYRLFVSVAGVLQFIAHRLGLRKSSPEPNNTAVTAEEFAQRIEASRRNKEGIIGFSTLLELNTGLPYSLAQSDFDGTEPDDYLSVLRDRVTKVSPEVEGDTIENVYVQYNCLQAPAQHRYRLQDYSGKVVMFAAANSNESVLASQFRPFVKNLRVRALKVGEPSGAMKATSEKLGWALQIHFRSMRDPEFVRAMCRELEVLIK